MGDAWKRDNYGFEFPQLYSGGEVRKTASERRHQQFASFRGANGAFVSPTWDYSFSDNITRLKGAHIFEGRCPLHLNTKDQTAVWIHGQRELRDCRQYADHRQRVRRRAAREFACTGSPAPPDGRLPVRPVRGVLFRRVAPERIA